MIKLDMDESGKPTFRCTVQGVAVYLDNFALIDLAKGDTERRSRFLSALRSGAELIFSVANLVDLSGPQGKSQDVVRDFLREIGPRWFPTELDVIEISKREAAGMRGAASCISQQFVKDYFGFRVRGESTGIIDVSRLYGLEAVFDWIGPQRDSMREGMERFDHALVQRITTMRNKHESDPEWLDRNYPVLTYKPQMPATFALLSLQRVLVLESKSHRLKRGDGLDLSHAVIGSAFASVSTLDKQWKRRTDLIPTPHRLAPIYTVNELDEMVARIEFSVAESSKK
jgi:hypothetical protein